MHVKQAASRGVSSLGALASKLALALGLVVALTAVTAGVSGARPSQERSTYIVLGDDPALASYRGGIAGLAPTMPAVTGAEELDVHAPASRAYRTYLAEQRNELLAGIEARVDREPEVLFRYDAALNGVALELTESEAAVVARLRGVRRVLADEVRYLQTDNGPAWIGAPGIWSGSATSGGAKTQGEGVVVGVIDTGINTDHPSFADIGPVDGYNHANPKGRFFGLCNPVTGAPFCNDKLIGLYDFNLAPPPGGEDANGHGSHTASTAAGNVLNARLVAPTYTLERRISGVAPHANIIAYRACQVFTDVPQLGECQLSALVAAINQATLDEVDVVNYSIGGGSVDPWTDADALAFLNARRAGIFVSASAGNDGPGAGTIGSPADAPWVMAVGASTHDRKIVNALIDMAGGGGTPPGNIEGKSLTGPLGSRPIVYAGDFGAPLCGAGVAAADGSAEINPFPPGTFSGQIVVCDRGTYGRVEKAQNVAEGGAGGFVLANDLANGDSLTGDAYPIPGVHVSYDDGVALKAWLASGTGETAAIRGTTLDIAAANGDVMASFSSRGPNPASGDLLKPDVTAPGVDILAAFHNGAGPHPQFGVISGTSMSSPHAAGAAALMVALHPTWTPDEIRSALMTTASTQSVRKEDGVTAADPFDMGAGRIDLRNAGKAGLVLDETPGDYLAANPGAGGDPRVLNLPSMADNDCDGFCSWTRTVENVRNSTVTWTASATASPGVTITVAPRTFTLAAGASRTISVVADVSEAAPELWHFGRVDLTPSPSSVPAAHLPVAAFARGEVVETRKVLHFHGNAAATGADHDSGHPGEGACTGDGKADLVACAGPMLLSSDVLSPSPAASWKGGPAEWALLGANDRTIHDPSWAWCLSVHAPQCPTTETPAPGPVTVEGPMTVEWWAECLALCAASSPDWHVRLWADGVQVVDAQVVPGKLTMGAVHKLRATVTVPRTTAIQRLTVQLEPVFLADQAVQFAIFYDSTQACPTASGGSCDSIVKMPVVEDGGGENRAPDAVNDSASVQRSGSTTIAVLANDTDPDGDSLSVSSATQPANGTATVNADGTITYAHDGNTATSDSFTYTISDGRGGTDTASVSITIADEPPPPGDGDETTGGGWLTSEAGGKINFGFKAKETASGLEGDLQLNDKSSNVKIHVTDVTALVAGACGADSVQLDGTGTYNGASATFRVCVDDNGEGAGSATGDVFRLECLSACAYDTSGPAVDDAIDGGNVQVDHGSQPAASPLAAGAERRPSTLILDPLLLTMGVAGRAQVFTVRVYDQNQDLMPNASVTLTRTAESGVTEKLTGITGLAGTVSFTVVNLTTPAEYIATAAGAQSNAIALTPLVG
jgi:subtilisin family serine protease